MNPSKRAKEVAKRRPDPFNTVCMNLANAIGIVISCPLTVFMTDHSMWPIPTGIPTPPIRIDHGLRERERMHMPCQRLFIRVMLHTQSHLSTRATQRPNNRWTIVGVGAVALPCVAAPTGRVFHGSVAIPFLTRILEHLISFGTLIRQRRNRLYRFRMRRKHPPQRHHCLTI